MKLKHLFARRPTAPRSLYGAIVAAARRPELYATCGIADNSEQRLGLIALFLGLLVYRLKPTHGREMQALVELYAADIEGNLREMGVSDVAIPRHMREVEARYVRSLLTLKNSLAQGIAGEIAPLREGLSKLVQADKPDELARLVLKTHLNLAALPPEAILAGEGLEQ